MTGPVSGLENVKDTVQSEQLFRLQLVADSAAMYPAGALGDLKTSVGQTTRIKGLEEELEKVMKEKGSLDRRLKKYNVYLKKTETMMENGNLNSLPLSEEFNGIQRKGKVLWVLMDLLHRLTGEVISKYFAKRQRGLKLPGRLISSLQIKFWGGN